MTACELARKLLEGPDVPVVTIGREANDDSFDGVVAVEPSEAWQVDYGNRLGWDESLWRDRPGNGALLTRSCAVLVLR